jgi:hypothetical protein
MSPPQFAASPAAQQPRKLLRSHLDDLMRLLLKLISPRPDTRGGR